MGIVYVVSCYSVVARALPFSSVTRRACWIRAMVCCKLTWLSCRRCNCSRSWVSMEGGSAPWTASRPDADAEVGIGARSGRFAGSNAGTDARGADAGAGIVSGAARSRPGSGAGASTEDGVADAKRANAARRTASRGSSAGVSPAGVSSFSAGFASCAVAVAVAADELLCADRSCASGVPGSPTSRGFRRGLSSSARAASLGERGWPEAAAPAVPAPALGVGTAVPKRAKSACRDACGRAGC